jgi:hypothetical protein
LNASADPPPGIGPIGPTPPELDLRGHLATALAAAGFGEVCLDEDRPPPPPVGPAVSGALISVALAVSAALALNLELGLEMAETIGAAAVLWIGILLLGQKKISLLFLMMFWLVLAVVLWRSHGFLAVIETYGISLAVTGAIYGLLRARKSRLGVDLRALLRSMPLLFPLVLLLLLVPLVTQDLWRVAVTMGATRLVILAFLTVLPLAIVFGRRLIVSLPAVISETSTSIATNAQSVSEVQYLVERLVGSYAGSWVLNHGRTMIQQGYEVKASREYAPFLTAVVKRPALAFRTAIMLIGLGTAVFAYLYLLAVILVDSTVAREWSKDLVPAGHVELLGAGITFLGGPYIAIAALLGIVALGAFLALLTVEESYSRAMAGALVNEPVKDYLLLSLPYVRLRERKILGEAPSAQSGPLAPPSA